MTRRLQITARRDEFPALARWVESTCAALAGEDRLRLLLLVEELFCNTLEHGYRGECDQPISVELQADASGCRLLYRDQAPEFDPFADRGDSLLGADPDLRPVGGLGLLLLQRHTSWRRYRREGDCNEIQVYMPAVASD